MTSTDQLQAVLSALESKWRDLDLPLVKHLRSGLDRSQVDALTTAASVRLPSEAQAWWQWHDGVAAADCERSADRSFSPQLFELLPLSEAIELNERQRELAQQAPTPRAAAPLDDPDYWWSPDWFPITRSGSGAVVACDCSVAAGMPTPIRVVDWHVEDFEMPRTPSLVDTVKVWLDAYDTGAWQFDRASHRWHSMTVSGTVPSLNRLL